MTTDKITMTSDGDTMKYTAIVCFLLGAILYAVAGIVSYVEKVGVGQ